MTSRTATILVAALLVFASVGPAAASHADGGLFDGLEDDSSMTLSERAGVANEAIAGILNRVRYDARQLTADSGDNEKAVSKQANETADVFNANNKTMESYINSRFDGTASEWDVIRVEFTQGDAHATRYIVADGSNGNFSNAQMVNQTDRSVDAELGLEGYASANAAEELDSFITNYASQDKDIDRGLRRRLANQYGGNVELPDGVIA